MPTSPATPRYSSLSIAIHWFMLLLLVAVYACMELREFYPRGSAIRDGLKIWHYMLGLSVFALVLVRIVARIAGGTPPISPVPPAWQIWLAKLLHLALYAMMIGLPIVGWLILSAEGDPVPFFGLELPPLVAPDKALAERLEELHETVAKAGYFLIGLHAVAALFHHYVMRDDVLTRMRPAPRR
jgi:cytochrome b561